VVWLGRRAGEGVRREVAVGAGRTGGHSGRRRHVEVGEDQMGPQRAGGLEQQVGRLDVAMHEPGRVHSGQGVEKLVEQHRDERRR
jgi:hypothetical protein